MIFFPKIYEACGQIFDKLNKVTTANQSFAIAFLACPLQENSKKLGLASNGISWFIKSVCYFNRANMETWTISCNFCGQIGLHRVSTDQPDEASFFQRQKKVMFAHHHGEAMISVFSCLYTIFYIEEQTPFYGNCTERACRNIKPPKKLSQQCDS